MAIYFGKTVAEKLAIAEIYFGVNSHILANDWAKISDDDKKAGLVQAEREVNLYLGISLEESYSATSFPIVGRTNFRPDYAIFEQAYFILDNTARTEGGSDGAKMIESELYQTEERDTGVGLSPQAVRFLQLNHIQIELG